MKSIIIYYSLEGNTKCAADAIAKITGAEVLGLQPKKPYPAGKVSKFVWGGKGVVFGERPPLEKYSFSPEEYDVIILGTPIWAGSYAPPMKTFLGENKLNNSKLAFFACSGGGRAESCFEKMLKETGAANVIAELSLIEPKNKKMAENNSKIEKFCHLILDKEIGENKC